MFAIIETGGKQYKVTEGQVLEVEKLEPVEGEEILFDKVLLVSKEGHIQVGNPYLESIKVHAKKVRDFKGKKVIAFTYKKRKSSKRKVGHRQPLSMVKIEKLEI